MDRSTTVLASLAAAIVAGGIARAEPPAASPAAPPAAPVIAPHEARSLYLVAPLVEYPREALRSGIEGRCNVAFRIDAEGVPYEIRPICNSPLFDAAAVRGVERVRMNMANEAFTPGALFRLPLIFRIADMPPSPGD